MKHQLVRDLGRYLDVNRPIFYIPYFDFTIVEKAIEAVAKEDKAKVIEFDHGHGLVDFFTKSPCSNLNGQSYSLEEALKLVRKNGWQRHTYIVLKDVQEELKKPAILALLKRMATDSLEQAKYKMTVFLLGEEEDLEIPLEIKHLVTVVEVALPNEDEIKALIKRFMEDNKQRPGQGLIDEMAIYLRGLHEFQIKQILALAYGNDGSLDKADLPLIIQEKKQLIKKDGLLEVIDSTEEIGNIGGLENLKAWLQRKGKVFKDLDKALKFGVAIPKGIMIVGMPGCGKSLAAKATAGLFALPLVRLDVGRLLGKYVGESEKNMRQALKLAEAISPCVLWIDEIEKAFAGVGSGSSEVTTRLFGQFLTWMQEKDNTVFIVATANDISNMPPEFLRKGRFDEIFFVDLPNAEERQRIIKIHLEKIKKYNSDIDLKCLGRATNGYNGADLEAIVKEAVENAFLDNEKPKLTTEDISAVIKTTKSISQTLKTRLTKLKEKAKEYDFKPAGKA